MIRYRHENAVDLNDARRADEIGALIGQRMCVADAVAIGGVRRAVGIHVKHVKIGTYSRANSL
jgi:hypothetical protein